MDDLEKYLDKQLENEEFKKEWEEFQPELQLIKEKVAKIIIKNIDDLGKNFEEIKSNFDYLVVHGVILQFLEQPILNTLGKSDDTL